METLELLTFGHGTGSQPMITDLLCVAGIESLVDVRTAPGSRAHPHVARRSLEEWLPAAGIDYRWEPRLGGFRRAEPGSPDASWRNASFRGYAGHLRTPEGQAALHEVVAAAAMRRTVVMCSESLWWRCHRRLIADSATLVASVRVLHLMHDARLEPHRPSPGARVEGDVLVYDRALE